MRKDYYQRSLFDDIPATNEHLHDVDSVARLTQDVILKFKGYSLQHYKEDVEAHGLEYTWDYICEYVLNYGENTDFLTVCNFGEMYEIGLAIQDKQQKKKNGQYFTPDDVADLMSEWLDTLEGEDICDVGCGT